MNDLTRQILAVIAVIVLAMALSATPDGAKFAQAGIIIAIIVVVLKNTATKKDANGNLVLDTSSGIGGAVAGISNLATKSPSQPSSS